jgi:hypothetical protein
VCVIHKGGTPTVTATQCSNSGGGQGGAGGTNGLQSAQNGTAGTVGDEIASQ